MRERGGGGRKRRAYTGAEQTLDEVFIQPRRYLAHPDTNWRVRGGTRLHQDETPVTLSKQNNETKIDGPSDGLVTQAGQDCRPFAGAVWTID